MVIIIVQFLKDKIVVPSVMHLEWMIDNKMETLPSIIQILININQELM